MTSLGEAFPLEQARLRKLLVIYAELGPVGTFARLMIEDCLQRADKAVVEQDLASMIRIYQEMKEFKE